MSLFLCEFLEHILITSKSVIDLQLNIWNLSFLFRSLKIPLNFSRKTSNTIFIPIPDHCYISATKKLDPLDTIFLTNALRIGNIIGRIIMDD